MKDFLIFKYTVQRLLSFTLIHLKLELLKSLFFIYMYLQVCLNSEVIWHTWGIFDILITVVLLFYYLNLTELYDTWDKVIGVILWPGDWIAKIPKKAVKIGQKF